ncbi:MAG TPA: thymidine phosphorylase, partial [Roseiarcus sp.]|nr:thymidine phosphorylase [Roseiarcus sp.]
RKKRDGVALSAAEITAFIQGATRGDVSEGQIGAFTMAVYLNGMTIDETAALALAMRDSGRVLDWAGLALDEARLIDKHSSGGVGDEKITLLVVPLAAACGVLVPNLSGRGLDYCAGEIDMLDAIPGYQTAPPPDLFMQTVKDVGGAIISPTLDLAPADRKLFYVRDVTATVESIPLITGSILSKKLASAPRGLVVSVGAGSGAYMASLDDARRLASSMAEVSARAGTPNVMLLTDLDSVLGTAVGNAVGVAETVEFLTGRRRDPRVLDLVLSLTAEMVVLAGIESDLAAARRRAAAMLDSGAAAERFARMVKALGGPGDFLERAASYLPAAPLIRPVFAERPGFVAGMNAKEIGLTLVALGGGRKRPDETIDLGVGLAEFIQVGDFADRDRPLCVVHARDEESYELAARRIRASVQTSAESAGAAGPIVKERLSRRP